MAMTVMVLPAKGPVAAIGIGTLELAAMGKRPAEALTPATGEPNENHRLASRPLAQR